MTFKNANFKTRNYDCTNIVACVCDVKPVGMPQNWIECSEDEVSSLGKLWVQDDANGNRVQLLGHL